MAEKKRGTYLTVPENYNLDVACRAFRRAFDNVAIYLVGSVLERPDYRDVDLRCILDDEEFDKEFFGKDKKLKFLNVTISEWMAARSGLNIDFQFQRQTDANKEFEGPRHAKGMFVAGDAEIG